MNKSSTNTPIIGGVKNTPGFKSLTPAVLGVPNPHGVKLSLNMTSENKKELFTKLEEWRQARKEKLAASILAKQKQSEKSKALVPVLPLKTKQISAGSEGASKIQDRQSVFERLYKNGGKIKKPESVNSNKLSQIPHSNVRKSKILSHEKPNKPGRTLLSNNRKTGFLDHSAELGLIIKKENEKEPVALEEVLGNENIDSVNYNLETENQANGDDLACVSKKKINESVKLIKSVSFLRTDQVNHTELKSDKSDISPKISSKIAKDEKQKHPLRRSISMMFRQKHRTDFGVRRSISAKNLNEINLNMPETDHGSLQILPQSFHCSEKRAKDEAIIKSVSFITPKHNGSLTSTHLRSKLENWLNMNGHSLEGYRHLRCFGIANSGKSILRGLATSDNSFENSYYVTSPNFPATDSDKENVTPPTVEHQLDVKDVENWLKELHRLISEVKYPPERCEEWLAAIRRKHVNCSQLPIYWECLAALHESKGDLKSAIEDYERAIVKGGEVEAVGNSLADLFDKLVIEQKKNSQRKLEKGLDPKNIFKSTIIKFALQQKALKKLSSEIEPRIREQLYIATPVRRSTRIQTPFKSTEVNSLQNLTPEVLKNVEFKPNQSLLSGN